ncbi:hypothetical protein SLEP1_g18958 [Rubroshorea leprosula]|uniref:CUB domain-containing protein n=1 Tax=Rubroshorea leprosula TaxID=152421 RepID=A0AAV5IZ79_9ROSI|nr:hypothetical protein SLEP1_g18958 [Rubroshorea leprosula]
MLLIESVRSSDPVSGDYTPANSVTCQWEVYNTGMTYRGDVYFVLAL